MATTTLRDLLSNYYELNSSAIEELDAEPSPLEFMRYVSRNTPFVIRGGASSWKATQKWDAAYLKSALAGQTVNVAITPHGNADAPTFSPKHGITVLSKPHEEPQMFDRFLGYVIRQEIEADFPENSEVRYAQTQNDNLRDEYACLFPDAQRDIPFARIALRKGPDAVNLWIGNSKSVTAVHKDNFENIFVQVVGRKHFVLLPPVSQPCMNEVLLPPATYKRDGVELSIRLDDDADLVPIATWDPEDPQVNATPLSQYAQPMKVTLNPGDMLYLPAMWYDMDFSGPLYSLASLVRALSNGSTRN
ncbi:hypothetical protein UVI_02022300 [Ustilaginoidea virens]|uniref:JmjC domain-containing protein n=1 Tax=Ustilaginoidea virens TaxID=1159556 RepID=A0A1B5L3B9_USTVR|nr:hypothetical protein UVI_02022300 [Ustilaginoidea virens]